MRYAVERSLAIHEITNALAFSPDGALLAVATRDKHASNLLVRLDDGALLPAPRFVRRDLAFAPDGALFVAGVSVNRFEVGGPKASRALLKIPGHPTGLTRISLSPNGLWALVTRYFEDIVLWHLGGAAPSARWKIRVVGTERVVFGHDSASLWAFVHEHREGGVWDMLQRVRLRDDGAVEGPDTLPLPAGLSPWDQVLTTPHALYAVSLKEPVLRRLDAATLAPVGDGIDALGGRRDTFVMAPDGACLVAQGYVDPPEGGRRWRLVHVALPSGRAEVAMELGEVSAGLLAVAPGGERIAYTRSDTDRTLVLLRRELA
jgi:hypothetical protein